MPFFVVFELKVRKHECWRLAVCVFNTVFYIMITTMWYSFKFSPCPAAFMTKQRHRKWNWKMAPTLAATAVKSLCQTEKREKANV